MPDLVLSADQARALDVIEEALAVKQRVLCLTGPAGSGKTALVRILASRLRAGGWGVVLLASTGKAAARLQEVTREGASTIHSVLFGRVTDREDGTPCFSDPRAPCSGRTLVVVDEASMVDSSLHRELVRQLPRDAALLYVGDREQLPPVAGEWGPDFEHPTVVLTEIHRQALGNTIVAIATLVREGGKLPRETRGEAYSRVSQDILEVVDEVVARRERGEDVAVLCWTNELRQAFNRQVRRRLAREAPICPGDRLVVGLNNRVVGRMNGEVLVVAQASLWLDLPEGRRAAQEQTLTPFERGAWWVRAACGARFWAHPELIGASVKDFKGRMARDLRATRGMLWLHVDYGEALTVHRAQGSEFSRVVFLLNGATRFLAAQDPVLARRLVYTACTRARETLQVVDL